MSTSVVCIVSTVPQAEIIIDELKMYGFESDDVSFLMSDQEGNRDLAYEKHSKAPEGSSTGAAGGALAGGALGWLAGVGAIAVPGLGPFIAAGPIMAALSGAAVGGAIGGVTGGLIGLGVPEYEAKQYAGKLEEGNILISVHAENDKEAKNAEQIMTTARARDVHRVDEEAIKHK